MRTPWDKVMVSFTIIRKNLLIKRVCNWLCSRDRYNTVRRNKKKNVCTYRYFQRPLTNWFKLMVIYGRTWSLGMDDSLRNPLPVEVSHLISEHKILQQHRSPRSHSHGGCFVAHRSPGACCHAISILKKYTNLHQILLLVYFPAHYRKFLKKLWPSKWQFGCFLGGIQLL